MILQISDDLDKDFHAYGCYEMSLLHLINKIANVTFTPAKIRNLHRLFVNRGWVRHDDEYKCYILNPTSIMGYFGITAQTLVLNGTHRISPDHRCTKDQVEIQFWKRPGEIGHFVVGDGHGHVAYDPMGSSLSVKYGALLNKRVFRIISVKRSVA